MRHGQVGAAALAAVLLAFPALSSAEKVVFEPVRAPSKGPDSAKVTVYEVADFM